MTDHIEGRSYLSEPSLAELRQRALTYRSMAVAAPTLEQHSELLRLAWQYEKLAMERQSSP